MLLDWFNAREASEVGARLADRFLPKFALGLEESGTPNRSAGARAERLLHQAAREVRPLKLNFFKRTKLLASLKWRLLEHGFDRGTVEELVHSLLLQITTGIPPATANGVGSAQAAESGRTKRLSGLLAEGAARFAKEDYQGAVEQFREVVAIDPRHAVGHARLGASLLSIGQYGEAERELRHALELKATCPDAQLNLGGLLRLKGEFAASETALRRAVKQDPRSPEALVALGLTLGSRNQLQEARSTFEKALRAKSRHAGALSGLGWVAGIEGQFGEAEALFRRALEADPRTPAALAALPDLRRMTPADKDWLAAAEQALAAGMAASSESRLRFAMGKYFDDLRDFSRAFAQYKRGNELCKPLATPYDRAARAAFVDQIIRVYSRQALMRPLAGASDSAKPVFVTGMPRSGTSLVDQILASHPQVAGAGELEFWHEAARKHDDILRHELADASLARKLTDSCLSNLARHSSDASRVVDKSNFNTDYLGIIHSLFPKARVIYVQRDPIDTCLSCYFQHFAIAAAFTMDLSDLAHYYREHHRLVQHWRTVLPPEAFLEVRYADLVADQEKWSRRIIEFLGLEWDPRCLEFHKTERAVLTASNWQVRQRIYSSSLGRWKNYEKFIGPLLKLRDLAG